jgi:L-alanine-DL-glutamate epimerase-like enolase superfamily enzyme
MRITDVKLRLLAGSMPVEGEFWEERLSRPLDIYPEHKAAPGLFGDIRRGATSSYPIEAVFVQIETDEGLSGLGGPIQPSVAYIIDTDLRWLLQGADPIATERLWDLMYRQAIHGRKGATMLAISAVDCALWDLRGKAAGLPVHRLLGGPVRETFPAYASALGFSLAPELVEQRARSFVEQGYTATKWFVRHGPTDGRAGMERNLELVRTLRGALGPDVDIMLDAWSSWDVPYTVQMAERLADYDVRWIEEPVLADKIDACAEIRRRSKVPIATGEHEYTRWGLKQLMDARAADVLQPDIYWAGGISEMLKIAALASAYDLVLIPHGHSTHATAQFIAAQSPTLCPILEYLIKWNEIHQFFLLNPLRPVGGMITVPGAPGMGTELDEGRIERERELRWSA